ncbi:protein shisa-5-like [Branchiostoma lanceolatum]|uniref:protein shisa-5-like n=1 Tax=Branchiostoma lanceolatum TaxID=7740 RepID=UPI00345463A1
MMLRIVLGVLLGAVWAIDAAQVCRTAHGRPFSCPRSRVHSFAPEDIYCCGMRCCSDPCRSTVSRPDRCMADAWKFGSFYNMNMGTIVGLVVGAITLTVIIVGVIVCCCGKARKNNKKKQMNAVQMNAAAQPVPSPQHDAQYPAEYPAQYPAQYPAKYPAKQPALYPAQQPAYPQYPQDVYTAFGHTSKI